MAPFSEKQPVVLYVEDNPDNRKLVKKLLDSAGYQTVTQPDGPSGLTFLETTKPDLILVDVGMPIMDGYQLAGTIRANPEFHQIPIVAVTAHAMQRDEERSIEAGCNGFIRKPIDIDRFPEEVQSFIDRRDGSQSESPQSKKGG